MTAFESRLQALRQRFADTALEEAREIEARMAGDAWGVVRDISHGIAGRAGMFGFAALTDSARTLERAIDDGEATARLLPLAGDLIAQLRGLSDPG